MEACALSAPQLANRHSWEPNTPCCTLCARSFGLFRRAHHCRLCGRCVDDACAPMTLVFLETACSQVSVRVCAQCRAEAEGLGGEGGGGEEAGEVGGGGKAEALLGKAQAQSERAARREQRGSDPSPPLLPHDTGGRAASLSYLELSAGGSEASGQQLHVQLQPHPAQLLAPPAPPAWQLTSSSSAVSLGSGTGYSGGSGSGSSSSSSRRSASSLHADPSSGEPLPLPPRRAELSAGSAAAWSALPPPPALLPCEAAAAAAFPPAAALQGRKSSLMPQRTDASSSGLVSLDKTSDSCEADAGSGGGGSGGGASPVQYDPPAPPSPRALAAGAASAVALADYAPPKPSAAKAPRRILNGALAGFGSVGSSSSSSSTSASSSSASSGGSGAVAPFRTSSSVFSTQQARAAPLEWEAGERRSKGGSVLPRRAAALGSEGGLGGGGGGGGGWGLAVHGLDAHRGTPAVSVGDVRHCRNCGNPFFESLREAVQDALSAEASTCSRDCYSTLKMQGIY